MKLLQRGTIAALLVTLSIATEFGFEELYNADTVEKLHEGIERKFRLGVDDFDSYRYTTLIRSLGMVAYYARLRRRFGRSQNGTYFGKAVKIPKKDSKEYDKVYRIRKYPAVPGQLNKRLLHLCSVNFITCVTRIENTVIQRYKPMYSGGKLRGLVRHFQRLPTEMILYDTTVSYMFCFFAHNKLLPMKALPYCNHGPAGTANGLTGVFNHRVMYGGEDRAYQCAIESFCPDPCCGLERDREGMGPGGPHDAYRNNCNGSICNSNYAGSRCFIESEMNNNMQSMLLNIWNVTCACPNPKYNKYDYALRTCIDINECADEQQCLTEANTVCVNLAPGFACVCKVGSYRVDGKCVDFVLTQLPWHGLAYEFAGTNIISTGILTLSLILLF